MSMMRVMRMEVMVMVVIKLVMVVRKGDISGLG